MKQLQFTFTEAQAQIILNALAARPFQEVNGLIEAFLSQAQAQAQAQQTATEESK